MLAFIEWSREASLMRRHFVPSPQERAVRIPGEHLTRGTCGKAQRSFTEVHLSGVERECREREGEGLDSWCGVKNS